jgi:multiple sugar transport system substrate-binding protein
MRRLIIVLLAAVTLAIGPSSRAAATPSSHSSLHGTVTFWNAYSPDEQKVLEGQVIPAFQRLYPSIHVSNLSLPYDGMFTKLITSIAGGTSPDVVRSDIIWVPQLANLHALQPLDKLSWFKTYQQSVFSGPLKTNYFHGHYYGLPLDTNTRVLFYSKTMFKAAGISGPPATTAQMLADCAKIKALGTGKYCYAEGGFGSWSLLPWVWAFGGGLTDSHYRKATGYLNGKGTVAAVNFLLKLYHDGYLSPNILGGGIGPWDGFGKSYAMILDGPWTVPFLFHNVYPSPDYGAALVPRGPGGTHSVVGGEDIVMINQTHNKPAAEAFMKFMLSKQSQTMMGKIGQMPVLKKLQTNSAFPAYYPIFEKQLRTAKPRTPSPQWSKIDDVFTTALQGIFRGNSTPRTALNNAAQQVNGLLR